MRNVYHNFTFEILAAGVIVAFAATSAFAQGECCSSKTAPTEKSQCSACNTHEGGEEHGEAAAHGGKHAGKKHGEGGKHAGKKGGHMAVMQGAHTLVNGHASITRNVTDIPGGVRTVTTTDDPGLVATIQKHPREMAEHLENGGRVRKWDPVFSELAKYQDKIEMKYKNLENGIEVTSTSKDEAVVSLIRAHAKKVSEFVKRGRAAMHEPTPLPEGYEAPEAAETHHH